MEPFKKHVLVMLNGRNIGAKHRRKKLEDMMNGPFEVIATGKKGRHCTAKLPDSLKIHPMFNIELLEWYQGTDPMKKVVEIEADDTGWKMELLIASGTSDDDPRRNVSIVRWQGYSHDENTWETYENVLECSLELLKEYNG